MPTDGSHFASRAIPYARRLTQATGARLVVVRGIGPEPVRADIVGAEWRHRDQARASTERLATELRDQGVNAQAIVSPLPGGEAILSTAQAVGADLIVMSTHGRSGLARFIYGSVADEVLRHAKTPLFLVPMHAPAELVAQRPPRIALALDGSVLAELAIEPTERLAAALGAYVVLLRAVDPQEFREVGSSGQFGPDLEYLPTDAEEHACRTTVVPYLESIAERLRGRGIETDVAVEWGVPAVATITRFALDHEIDVLAIATHGRGGFRRAVLGSVTEGILHCSVFPVLVAPPRTNPPARRVEGGGAHTHRVRDIMSSPAVVVRETTQLSEVARLMLDRGVGCIPVVGESGTLLGIITESDFTGRRTGLPFSVYAVPRLLGHWVDTSGVERIYQQARDLRAGDVMSRPVTTIGPEESVDRLVKLMVDQDRKRVPVVEDGVPIGVVARHDLLKLLVVPAADG